MRHRVLIVDDEASIRKVLATLLRRAGHDVVTAEDGAAALALLPGDVDLVITDLRMPGVDGMALLAHCRTHHPDLPVILITAHGTVGSAVEAIKAGAQDYITKPFDAHELRQVTERVLASADARRGRWRGSIIGETPAMRDIFALIGKVARSPSTVLITGESGTGKEVVARAVHAQSDRSAQPFLQVNCGAIPESLFESELFGHERGAFTGAVTTRPGRFELANGGTLFLDEIGELPLSCQVGLLRVLQDGRFERVGGVRTLRADVRLCAATNRDLSAEVAAGRFREDLFYRLNVIPIHLPPLRERPDDIPLLVDHFIARFNRRLGRSVRGVASEALETMLSYGWPGNIRELENLTERAVVLADADVLTLDDLFGLGDAAVPPPPSDELGLKEYVRITTERLERARIRRVLGEEGGNVTRAARKLSISRKSLQTKMKAYGLREVAQAARSGER